MVYVRCILLCRSNVLWWADLLPEESYETITDLFFKIKPNMEQVKEPNPE